MINETPVRTSKNFGINEYTKPIVFPNTIKYNGKISIDLDNVSQKEIKKINDIKYGIGGKVRDFYQANINQMFSFYNYEDNAKLTIKNEIEKDNTLCDYINIETKKNTSMIGTIFYSSKTQCDHFGYLNISLNEGSNLDLVMITDIGDDSNSYLTIQANTKDNANLKIIFVDFSGNTSVNSLYTDINGKNANADLDILYFGKKEGNLDYNVLNEVYGEKCKTSINAIGALQGNANKDFKGTINLIKGCIGSFGCENETCMLLSNTAKAKSLPMLLCTEENIEGGEHSSSVGKVDEKTIFYIMTRGLTEKEATKLAIRASLSTITDIIIFKNIKIKPNVFIIHFHQASHLFFVEYILIFLHLLFYQLLCLN